MSYFSVRYTIVIFISLLLPSIGVAKQNSIDIDHLKVGDTIFEFRCYESIGNEKCYRKLLEIKLDGYLVQDFESNFSQRKVTDPFFIKLENLKKPYPKLENGKLIIWERGIDEGKKILEANYKDGLLEGDYFYNGKFYQQKLYGQYKQDKHDGLWKYRNKHTDKLEWEMTFKEGISDGPTTKWHKNGIKSEQGQYKDGKKEGHWKYWSEEDIELKEEIYKKGELVMTLQNPENTLKINHAAIAKLKIKEGNKITDFGVLPIPRSLGGQVDSASSLKGNYYRKLIKVLPNGFQVQEFYYLHDQERSNPYIIQNVYELSVIKPKSIHGSYIIRGNQFNKDSTTGHYINGKRDGDWYESDGIEEHKGQYKDGKKEGYWVHKSLESKKVDKGSYINDKKDGKWIFEIRDGKTEGDFKQGNPVGMWVFTDSIGQKRKEFSQPYGTITEWYSNGQKEAEGYKGENGREGVWKEWHKNGKERLEEHWVAGKSNGAYIVWYENGQKKIEGQYKNNVKEGSWTTWYDTGIKETEGDYKSGKEHNKWVLWTKDGTEKTEGEYYNGLKEGVWITWYLTDDKETYTSKATEGEYKRSKKEGMWVSWYRDGQKKSEVFYETNRWIKEKSTYWNKDGSINNNQ